MVKTFVKNVKAKGVYTVITAAIAYAEFVTAWVKCT